jgi:uridine kinase
MHLGAKVVSIQQRVFELVAPWLEGSDRSALLAISGPSCSGKTTLAERVAEYAAESGHSVALLHFDDYLRPERQHPRREPEHVGYYEDAFDYPGLMQEVRRKLSGACHPDLVIVEGEFLLRREYRDAWDAKVWIEIEDALALSRGVARDAAFFGSEQEARRIYVDRCLPANEVHRQLDCPAVHADLVLQATPIGLTLARRDQRAADCSA